MSFKALNINNFTPCDDLPSKLAANAETDLWRKPPQVDVSNAPALYKVVPAKDFKRARVTVTANWTRLYDQGGIVFLLPGWPERKVWVKTGIEFVDGQPCVSVVAGRHDASDWSLVPLTGTKTATIEIEKEAADRPGFGGSLWVYKVDGEKRVAIREMTWVFTENEMVGDTVGVGIYVARPTKASEGESDNEPLEVTFSDFEVVA